MGGASHGSSRPVRTCPFDLITFHVFFISFWLFNLLYLTCVMVNKAVKKKKVFHDLLLKTNGTTGVKMAKTLKALRGTRLNGSVSVSLIAIVTVIIAWLYLFITACYGL